MYLSTRDLCRADWEALVRLARSVGLRVRDGPEVNRRSRLVDATMRRLVQLNLQDAARTKANRPTS